MKIKESITMTFPNRLDYSFMIQTFVREIAKNIGFSGDELEQIDMAVEESVSNVMVHTSEEENPAFDIVCERIDGGIKITLKEKGIPFDPEHIRRYELSKNLDDLSTAGLGIYLIQKVMDDLSFHNLGTGGKETVMIKYLPEYNPGERAKETNEQKISSPAVISEKIDYTVRGLDPSEAIEVSRCAYKTHGYTFFDDHIYYPERLVEMNRTSEMISAVAVTNDNIFMGHSALLYQYPEDTIAELTFVFVNVEYRGQGALNRLVDYLLQVPKKREFRGLYAYAVTNHIFTQKSMVKFRVNDCGLLLGTSPASWKFKGISDDASQRISVLLGFRYSVIPPVLNLYVPEHHQLMIRKLYDNLGAHPLFKVPAEKEIIFERQESLLKTGINELESCAEIFVAAYGSDILHRIRKLLRAYCVHPISAINLFLKLTDPLTFQLTKEIEKMGFFFAGILPESRIGDALILQYLNNVDLDYTRIQLLSDIAKELLVYIREKDPNQID